MFKQNRILETIQEVLIDVPDGWYDEIHKSLDNCDGIFIVGAGRSGLVGKFFAMRLKHLNFPVHVVGEVTTPKIQKGDVVIAITGSGGTRTTVEIAKKASDLGAVVWAITSSTTNSQIAVHADRIFTIGKNVSCSNVAETVVFMPLGTVFELATLTFLETLVGYIIEKEQITEAMLQSRHANLE